MMISQDLVDRFPWEAVRFKINACSFRFWQREVPENLIRKDWTSLRSDHWTLSLVFCSLSRCFSMFSRFRDHLVTGEENWSDFRKNARCEAVVQFWRPCRGLTVNIIYNKKQAAQTSLSYFCFAREDPLQGIKFNCPGLAMAGEVKLEHFFL